MALIPAKCTQCGANIQVDNTKEAGICESCGTAFITEAVTNLTSETFFCPNCGESVNVSSAICKHCSYSITDYSKKNQLEKATICNKSGLRLSKSGNGNKALNLYFQAQKIAPDEKYVKTYVYKNIGDEYSDKKNSFYDLIEAQKWYKLAGENGYPEAYTRIGMLCDERFGQNTLTNTNDAIKWYKLASDSGEIYAMNNLGTIYGDYKDDYFTAAKLCWKAYKKGNEGALPNYNGYKKFLSFSEIQEIEKVNSIDKPKSQQVAPSRAAKWSIEPDENLKISKKTKTIIITAIVAVIALIITAFVCAETAKKNKVIEELRDDAVRNGLVDFDISVKGKNSDGDYNVTITCDELSGKSYEEIYQIVFYVYSSDAEITFVAKGDKYKKGSSILYKNGEVVYKVKSTSSSHTCEQCSKKGTHSYTSPFSGETEWYCDAHYESLKALLGQFEMY